MTPMRQDFCQVKKISQSALSHWLQYQGVDIIFITINAMQGNVNWFVVVTYWDIPTEKHNSTV